jgi:hypothetical protein
VVGEVGELDHLQQLDITMEHSHLESVEIQM